MPSVSSKTLMSLISGSSGRSLASHVCSVWVRNRFASWVLPATAQNTAQLSGVGQRLAPFCSECVTPQLQGIAARLFGPGPVIYRAAGHHQGIEKAQRLSAGRSRLAPQSVQHRLAKLFACLNVSWAAAFFPWSRSAFGKVQQKDYAVQVLASAHIHGGRENGIADAFRLFVITFFPAANQCGSIVALPDHQVRMVRPQRGGPRVRARS